MIDDAILKFSRELRLEVEEQISDMQPTSEGAFTELILERLEEIGHFSDTKELYQEGRVRNTVYRIDGFAWDEGGARLDLFTTIHQNLPSPQKLSAAEVTRALERALRFASACVDGLAAELEPSNTDASDLARLIEERADEIQTVRVVLLTDGEAGSGRMPDDWKGKPVDCEVYDIVRLQRILGAGESRSDIEVDLVSLTGGGLPGLHIPSASGDYDAYLTVLPGEALSAIYDRFGMRLLELNVRAFLGIQGRQSVNSELRRTIVEYPSMFLAFNNGIVATVDEIETEQDTRGNTVILSLKGLQIVNGGQTTASLHRARRKESLKLDGVYVPIKIIKVSGADLGKMVTSISRAANRQNAVQLADFSANDPFHQQLETLANNTWLDDGRGRWFYERARGSYLAAEQKASYRKSDEKVFRNQTPKHRRLGKLDVARYLAAWTPLPHRVCLGGQKNFQFFMQRMSEDYAQEIDGDWFRRLVALAIVYRAVEKKVRAMKFPAYGAQITAYVVAALSYRTSGQIDFERIWTKQSISPELEFLVETWSTQIDKELRRSAGKLNPSEWFKNEDCWKEVQSRLPDLPSSLPPELRSGSHGVVRS
jgi:hypothetical protein